ncbi:MAG: AMP-binding protein [Methylococcaceae bacterium]|nr:AMP-binding protein [Methylococcaceae bacterium]
MTDLDPDKRQAIEKLLSLVREVVGELHPGWRPPPISLDASLDKDLGLDSLGRVELLSRIERGFEVALPENLFAEAETPRDLLRAVLRAKPLLAGERTVAIERFVPAGSEPVPNSADTLIQVLDWHVERHPDLPHIRLYGDEDEGQTLSYRQLQAGAGRVAAGLQALGVLPGQAVAIMLPTGAEYFFSFFGALLAGAVPVPMYPPPRLSHLEEHLRRHAAILANCMAPLLVTVQEGKGFAKLLCSQVDSLRHVISVDELSTVPDGRLAPQINGNDTAFLQYTSGSTGYPKGVVLSHLNLLANIRAMGAAIDLRADDVFVSWLPLYHDMGLIGAWLGSLYHAIPLVVMPPLSFLSRPQRWLWAIHRYRGTLSASPNFGYETCLRRLEPRDIDGLDLSSWRIAFNGAEAVSPETVERFVRRFQAKGFKPEAMLPVYGLAESSVGLAFPAPGRGALIDRIQRDAFSRQGQAIPAGEADKNALRFVSCGFPLPGHQIRLVDEAGRELPDRRQGRIQFKGPSATSGYFRNSRQTRELFCGDWLDSGDLGYMAEGELYVSGRIKDIVIRAGRNIYPQEVEQAVGEIEGIRKGCVAVFGGSDPDSGSERLIVLAETRRLEPSQAEALRVEVNSIVTDLIGAPPDEVVLAPPGAVLKTSSGKVRRAACRMVYERGEIGRPPLAAWLQMLRFSWGQLLPRFRQAIQRSGEWLFAGYAWSIFGLLAPPVWVSVMTLPSLAWRWRIMRSSICLLRWATRMKLTVQGVENLPEPGRPFVLVSNHASYLDAYVLIVTLPQPLSFVAKAELVRDPKLGEALRRIGTEFVERFDVEKGLGDMRRLSDILPRCPPLVFFAEGTFSRRPGLQPFHLGAFAAAQEAMVPVIPVALRGTRAILRDGSWFPRHGAISVNIGKPIMPSIIQPEGDFWEKVLQLRDQAREHILSHCGEPDLSQCGPRG